MLANTYSEKMSLSVVEYCFIAALFSLLPAAAYANPNESFVPTLIYSSSCLLISLFKLPTAPLPLQIDIKKSHLIQICGQLGFLFVWGLSFNQVIIRLPLLLSQIFMAVSTQLLIDILRRRSPKVSLEFFPMVLSLNFFLWFFPAYYWASICLVVVGVLGKNFLLWNSSLGSKHIFNPSGFSMAAAVYLIISFGFDQSSHVFLDAPSTMYLIPYAPIFIFFLSLGPQWFAGTMGISLGALLGFFFVKDYPFLDTSSFLAIALLVTDPSTAPKNKILQIPFGLFYFLSIFWGEPFFGWNYDAPFFAKVAALPALNFLVPYLDHIRMGWFEKLLNKKKGLSLVILFFYVIVFSLTWRRIGNPHFEEHPPFTVRHFMGPLRSFKK